VEAIPVIVIFGIIAVAIIAFSYYQKQLRLKFWQEMAAETNGKLHLHDIHRFASREEYPLFREGDSRRVDYLLECEFEGNELLLFDYEYKTGSGKNRRTHSLSGLMIKTPVYGSMLTLRSENFFDRIVSFMGFDDINFESEEFNRAFRVHCPDKKFAYDIFHTGMMELFLRRHQGLVMEWCGMHVLFYFSPARQFNQHDIKWLRPFACQFMELLPAYLIDEHRRA
jgi:hypothetical protein